MLSIGISGALRDKLGALRTWALSLRDEEPRNRILEVES